MKRKFEAKGRKLVKATSDRGNDDKIFGWLVVTAGTNLIVVLIMHSSLLNGFQRCEADTAALDIVKRLSADAEGFEAALLLKPCVDVLEEII